MSKPGQVLDGGTLRFPPTIAPPAGRALATAWLGDTAGGGVGLVPGQPTDLGAALAQTFDPLRDQIVWEDSHVSRLVVAPDSAGVCHVREETGMALALGLCAARQALSRRHWIVVVLSAESLARQLSHELIEQLQQAGSRFLVIVTDDGRCDRPEKNGHTGQFDELDAAWFSDLGLRCRGPLAGRVSAALLNELTRIRRDEASMLLHVRGSCDRRRALGSAPNGIRSLPQTGDLAGAFRSALVPQALEIVGDELCAMARPDFRVVTVVEASLQPHFALAGRHPARNFVLRAGGPAVFTESRGLALGGCRPFLIVTGSFLRHTLDQLAGELCESRQRMTLVVIADDESPATDGFAGDLRPTSDLGYLRLLPHTLVAVPRDEQELRRMLKWSTRHAGPVAIRVPRRMAMAHTEFQVDEPLQAGRAEILSEGQDATLLAVGAQVAVALRASELLSEQGVSAGVVNARFVSPVDGALLRRLSRQGGALLTLEEKAGAGGLGTAILEGMAAEGLAVPVLVCEAPLTAEPTPVELAVEQGARRTMQTVLDLIDGRRPSGGEAHHQPGRNGANGSLRPAAAGAGLDLFGFSAESLRFEREQVKTRRLSPAVAEWAEVYSQVGDRNPYLWQWCERGAEITTLPCVLPEHFDHVWQTKVLSIVLCVLLDDVADRHGQERFLDVLLRIVDRPESDPDAGLSQSERAYADVTRRLARIYQARTEAYPCHAVYRDLLQFDQIQFFNALRYSHLLNRRPSLLNLAEHDLYLPHNMHMMSFATLDLMCSPGFSANDLGKLREAVWHAQCMGRIGNLLASWSRECGQHDYTSGVFARAVVEGDLTLDQLSHGDRPAIETAIRAGGHERYFFRRWQHHKRCYKTLAADIRSVDLTRLLEGHERFLLMHLGSRGLI